MYELDQVVSIAHAGGGSCAYRVTDVRPEGPGMWTYMLEPVPDDSKKG
jgi:hypothetical protein